MNGNANQQLIDAVACLDEAEKFAAAEDAAHRGQLDNERGAIERFVAAAGTQAKAAEILQCSVPYISSMLSGRNRPSKKIQDRLRDYVREITK